MEPDTIENFDRTNDVSKLNGSDTRGVHFVWDVFERHLVNVTKNGAVLDFGAGSLRDTYELALRSYKVLAVDIDKSRMERFANQYEWPLETDLPELTADSLEEIYRRDSREVFDLVIAFDIFEHLEDPRGALFGLNKLLRQDGLLFCTVPNKYSVAELFFRCLGAAFKFTGKGRPPGVAHIQFKSPRQWRSFFLEGGFDLIEHEMAIGPLVNNWNGLWYVPSLIVRKITGLNTSRLPSRASPNWLMKRFNSVDRLTKKRTEGLYAWNLIVVRKMGDDASWRA